MIFEELQGTTISDVSFDHHGPIEITGNVPDTDEMSWKIIAWKTARFTYSHEVEGRSWFVEVEYQHDRGLSLNEKRMLCAMNEAVIRSFRVEGHGVFIESDDGRGIELYYDDNSPSGILIDLGTERPNTPAAIELPKDLYKLGLSEETF